MIHTYRRFKELKEKARSALKDTWGSNQDKLANAMYEIFT